MWSSESLNLHRLKYFGEILYSINRWLIFTANSEMTSVTWYFQILTIWHRKAVTGEKTLNIFFDETENFDEILFTFSFQIIYFPVEQFPQRKIKETS